MTTQPCQIPACAEPAVGYQDAYEDARALGVEPGRCYLCDAHFALLGRLHEGSAAARPLGDALGLHVARPFGEPVRYAETGATPLTDPDVGPALRSALDDEHAARLTYIACMERFVTSPDDVDMLGWDKEVHGLEHRLDTAWRRRGDLLDRFFADALDPVTWRPSASDYPGFVETMLRENELAEQVDVLAPSRYGEAWRRHDEVVRVKRDQMTAKAQRHRVERIARHRAEREQRVVAQPSPVAAAPKPPPPDDLLVAWELVREATGDDERRAAYLLLRAAALAAGDLGTATMARAWLKEHRA